jgi:cbb3-type cytochrome oxidase maturation protein
MEVLVYLVPLALALGLLGLGAFLWSLKTGQYEDLEGAGWRAIIEDEAPVAAIDGPVTDRGSRPLERKRGSVEHWI